VAAFDEALSAAAAIESDLDAPMKMNYEGPAHR